ncbi:helix-turn-helix domain-containing protein [Pseudonocardia sp. KRD291]|uniref:winged helix-turn-helix transcriptional regulator n=1 Tax=Pseudonocardia sp. KRD291 TaxID=2792007 RepID=UPI001C4A717A|nr:helix-turn-helix domain-containing protein [Pseudonocardia sp. KRD291]MBW0104583.1 helix-turn-helix transcriptional regulator [Pseudonocardia sp. KRD291]
MVARPDSVPAPGAGGHTACDGALAHAFGFLGKRWNGILIGTLMHGPASFSGLRRAVPGISESVLASRLTELSTAGLITREVCPGPPVTVVYSLTDSGQALVPVLSDLAAWSRDHLTAACERVGDPNGDAPDASAPTDPAPGDEFGARRRSEGA